MMNDRLLQAHGVWAPGVRLMRQLGIIGQYAMLLSATLPTIGLVIWQSIELGQRGAQSWITPVALLGVAATPIAYLLVSLYRVQRGGTLRLANALNAWAAGDVAAIEPPHGEDDIATVLSALARAKSTVSRIAEDVQGSGVSLALETDKLSEVLTALRSECAEIAGNMQVMAAALGEISTSLSAGAGMVGQATALSETSSAAAGSSVAAIRDIVASMTDIRTQAGSMEVIISTIDAIATKTHLLALNAAVEASRAGDSGRGFGVVALHVRELAAEAAAAAREIRQLINASKSHVDAGVKVVADAATAIQGLIANVGQTKMLLTTMATAMADQVQGIDQVSFSMKELDVRSTRGFEHVRDSVDHVQRVKGISDTLAQAATRLHRGSVLRHEPGSP